jgi:acetolactate synthase-1/2/3 large subunit
MVMSNAAASSSRLRIQISFLPFSKSTFLRSAIWSYYSARLAHQRKTKWDDAPVSLNGFAEAAMRGYKVAMTPPYGPVVVSIDKYLQEGPILEGSKLVIPKYSPTKAPQGDEESLAETARMLVNADLPVIIAERAARTEAGLKYMVELAELLQAGVVDTIQRMNFPSRHPLRQTGGVVSQADVILSLENPLLWSAVHAPVNDDFGAPALPGCTRERS